MAKRIYIAFRSFVQAGYFNWIDVFLARRSLLREKRQLLARSVLELQAIEHIYRLELTRDEDALRNDLVEARTKNDADKVEKITDLISSRKAALSLQSRTKEVIDETKTFIDLLGGR